MERTGVEVDGDGLAWPDGAVEGAGDIDLLGVVAWAPWGDLKVVTGGSAVVGALCKDLGLVSGGGGAIGEDIELGNGAITIH